MITDGALPMIREHCYSGRVVPSVFIKRAGSKLLSISCLRP